MSRGPYKDNAPDLIPGYQRGYRVSWETAIGRTTEAVFHDNTKAWSGDHCIDPSLIPGVLFCNRPVEAEKPRLMDLGPTIMQLFGVPVPEHMDGKALAVGAALQPAARKGRLETCPTRGGIMTDKSSRKSSRRTFLKGAAGATVVGAGGYWLGGMSRVSRSAGKKVIVIGIDGMDPRLSESMMNAGRLPHLARLREVGGFSPLATSTPPQSPVAWATFINSAGPGSHGIFDFIHRHPEEPCKPFYAAAETVGGKTLLRRQGVPFWDYLDAAGVPATFYDLPSNYPPSPSHHGHCRCISGMGTPDMLGTYGTYQHFAADGPAEALDEAGGKRFKLVFEEDSAAPRIVGPVNTLEKEPRPLSVATASLSRVKRRKNCLLS